MHIAVIDTAIDPDVPELQGVALRVHEPSFCADEPLGSALPARSTGPEAARGTSTVALILGTGQGTGGEPGIRGVAPDAAVSFYANATQPHAQPGTTERCYASDLADPDVPLRLGPAIDAAVAEGADILAIALSTPSRESTDAIARALRAGVLVVAAQGPASTGGFPADLDGVVSVDTVGPDDSWWVDRRIGATVLAPGGLIRTYGPWLDGYERSTAPANAVAFTAGALALVWSAYPEATVNQLLQSLVRNTGSRDHPLREPTSEVGYGVVDVPHLLQHDPAEYADVSPLLVAPEDDDPTPDPSSAGADETARAAAAPLAAVGLMVLVTALVVGLVVRRRSAGHTVRAAATNGSRSTSSRPSRA